MIYSLSHSVAPELWMFIRWAGAADEWECKKAASRASRKASTYLSCSCIDALHEKG